MGGLNMRPCSTVMHLLLRCMRGCGRHSRSRMPRRLRRPLSYIKLIFNSLYFNSLTNSEVVMDSILEPVFWMVEVVTRWFGMVFVFLVVALTSSVIFIAYFCLLPLVLQTYSPGWIMWHVCYGHWIIVMIAFHYYKATSTPPGYPPKMKNDIPFVSVCKKCIIPKPARSHHCGICKTCILKMDHHCPWLNNCVGHYNHRYFFSFCLYLTMGCMYCSISGRNLFIDAYNAIDEVSQPPYTYKDRMIHKSIIYMWVLTSTVSVALGALTLWHAILITRGETSIERHINNKEAKRLAKRGKVYRNPFSYGTLNNWKVFFGVEKRSHWLTRILLPSGHTPYGDGLTWDIYPLKKDMMPV
ncbi:palmitoyltransferase ZDHHC16A isoform X5 [Megalobrama amblycephala]|uniref:palmitoyltransferase ZDHHC16A isoform X5 n=1 Tax=Megalobrama amblycephala TaxID=75352 RepID=UPI00201429B7|nr:palmitoyltransferase ZDHHC16A isoform X5 [Megalobrama amblycephala]